MYLLDNWDILLDLKDHNETTINGTKIYVW
jgi:hypothetical protein